MPHARGFDPGRRDPPETREREVPIDEDGHILRSIAEIVDERNLRCDDGALRDDSQSGEPPDCNQQLARHGDDGDAAGSSLKRADALAEPLRQAAFGLIAQP